MPSMALPSRSVALVKRAPVATAAELVFLVARVRRLVCEFAAGLEARAAGAVTRWVTLGADRGGLRAVARD
jgi:hypothetical protein